MTKSNLKAIPIAQPSVGPQARTQKIGPLSSTTVSRVSVKSLNTGVKVNTENNGKV